MLLATGVSCSTGSGGRPVHINARRSPCAIALARGIKGTLPFPPRPFACDKLCAR